MKVKVLYDQGTACVAEDGIIFYPPCCFGVTDGVSGVYLPQEGPRLFNQLTGGQLASKIISRSFGSAIPGETLENILRRANNMLREISKEAEISLEELELLPSADFVVVRLDTSSSLSILQGGDSLAIWQMKDGTIGGTPNKVYSYEKELLQIVAGLMKKHKGDRQKMWREYRPILIEKRRANTNTEEGGFAVLNGQSEFECFWQKFTLPRKEIGFLILFSDGFIPFEWTENVFAMAGEMIRLYRKGELHSILEATRVIADKKKSLAHEDYAEATAIAIEF